ncbi:hypothetical protein HMPREF0381_2575 [Lachnoanaerobaculum saburreum DSM 3986]|uniref:Uncharacterized protein n=1 Tax=Lachnoanaerobaculum saburreum DSM 3986 TaxID=887325 RepID=E6LRJ0_9FIRM|nr:hypothetical protein HMPREF0381_2575 [Lachnoanaerobaculum saburreum DSM 3986]
MLGLGITNLNIFYYNKKTSKSPVPVTAAQTGVIVVLTNINILRKTHGMIIVIHW